MEVKDFGRRFAGITSDLSFATTARLTLDQNLLWRGARDYSETLATHEFTLEPGPLAVRVQDAVKASGLEIPVIARHARVSKSWIYDIINGDIQSPGVDKLDRLAKALGVTRDWLLTGKEHDEPTIENLAQLVAWDKQQAQQRLRHLENVIEAEVQRRLEERWAAVVRQQGLTHQEVAVAERLNAAAAAEESRLSKSQPSGQDSRPATRQRRAGTAA